MQLRKSVSSASLDLQNFIQGNQGGSNLENGVKISGYLSKKSPKFLVGYQKRFFMVTVTKSGEIYLAYFKNDKLGQSPKGAIKVKDIEGITTYGK